MTNTHRVSLSIAAGIAAASLCTSATLADSVGKFYKNKTVTMIVGSGAGGGFGLTAG